MRAIKVKICGITREEDLTMVTASGVDAVGFVIGVPSSPRNLSIKMAEKLIERVPIFVKSVLVMAPISVSELAVTYNRLRPDAIQIHENITWTSSILREKLPNTSLIKAINTELANNEAVLNRAKTFDAVLLDSFSPGKYGGTGLVHDWSISNYVKGVVSPKPIILAGGLTPENVDKAIKKVQPYAVDVSTGVESRPGIKDPKKVMAFINNVKNAKQISIFEKC